jgi:hypothetical protein
MPNNSVDHYNSTRTDAGRIECHAGRYAGEINE